MLANTIIQFPSNIEHKETITLKKGQIWKARLNGEGSVQRNERPVIVFQNDMASKFSPTVTVIPLTSKMSKKNLPTHVFLEKELGLPENSIALCEQVLTIDKKQLIEFTGTSLNTTLMKEILKGILTQLGISFH